MNSTEIGNCTTIQEFCCLASLKELHGKIISALNIPFSIIALMGNILILVAFQKLSSLHPSSKLLFGCLATTDLCVGLITQPLFVTFLLASEHSKLCYYSTILSNTMGFIFCGVSLFTLTGIGVDRLLALMLGLRYRLLVTLKRVWVLVVFFWLFSTVLSIPVLYRYSIGIAINGIIMSSCVVTSIFCYTKIYFVLHRHQAEVQAHASQGQLGISLNIARYRKTVSSALWVQMTLLACYVPASIVTVLRAVIGLYLPTLNQAHAVTITLLLLNSTLNPFLYCWKIRDVRRAVKDTTKKLNCF